ncbi:molybdopterin converting factor subunit 1 [Cohaesibacter celericrescens]|uniref:Molybdopterin converting factor subunit 1 n=1 Tax=Cohaesibacter celericrescens TaxID=2067669 RepID=A0A2N5XXA1_9HYPH|nr:molybdopterin converting factor subunit 1 [Cohaesibacter celericrescens]PLW79143.1 molybdopterin converting factor subunit 1 [Cohaesibacter celericrescens]
MKLVYFAWIRERIGLEEEEAELPDTISTVDDLLRWQQGRGEEYAAAFSEKETIRVALDQFHAEHSDPLNTVKEIAFFPPMTGG